MKIENQKHQKSHSNNNPVIDDLLADEQPIAALASGNGPSAIAIIRVSGKHCHDLIRELIDVKATDIIYQKLYLSKIFDPIDQVIIDQPLVVFFKGPHSYTGQDSIEIHCHGSPYIIQKTLLALYYIGIRAAEPGEFTKRAYLNGKLDLTSAEGIKELIAAQTHEQWFAARQLISGKLSQTVENLRLALVEALALLAARIDFPDEKETSEVHLEQVCNTVEQVASKIAKLIKSYQNGRIAAEGLTVAIVGRPNSGKSTLLNTLLERPRAIVSPIAGTTRDYLEETCLINGRLVRLFDTAGIRKATDELETIGIEWTNKIIAEADLVIVLHGADQPLISCEATFANKTLINIISKADLQIPEWATDQYLGISCHTGFGIETLKQKIVTCIDQHVAELKERPFISTVRQLNALKNSELALERFRLAAQRQSFDECLAFELQEAAKYLKAIIGDVTVDDVLDTVFSNFCVGK